MKVEIKRDRWLRGEGSQYSWLLESETRHMCCLGFMCLAFGFTEEDILRVRAPQETRIASEDTGLDDNPLFTFHVDKARYINSMLTDEAMNVNDDPDITDLEREEKLIEMFKDHGIKLEFV